MLDTVVLPLLGGALIGAAAIAMMAFHGRIAGISGIFGGLLSLKSGDIEWRALFVGGLVAGGLVAALISPGAFIVEVDRSLVAIIAAGLLVGFGTRLGSGCTSGHGICGISRFSPRSLVATPVFIGAGAVTVFIINTVFGGAV